MYSVYVIHNTDSWRECATTDAAEALAVYRDAAFGIGLFPHRIRVELYHRTPDHPDRVLLAVATTPPAYA